MIILNLRTVKGRRINAMGAFCTGHSLSDFYKTWSNAKNEAFNRCVAMCEADNGMSFRVGSANTFSFIATWVYKKDDIWYRRVETKDNSYIVIQD